MLRELDHDQAREAVNTRQRFDSLVAAERNLAGFKGSMTWMREGDAEYLVRSAYDPASGIRRNKSLGPRSKETEKLKADYDAKRETTKARVAELKASLSRQEGKNRAVGIGRMPLLGARIVRALNTAGLLGKGIRIVGTNAIYAYEAVAGVFVEDKIMDTDDIDLLFDSRQKIRLTAPQTIGAGALLRILKRVDRSFELQPQTFRAANRDGYLVDLIKPAARPPWKKASDRVAHDSEADLIAAEIDGLHWLQSVPPFEAVAIDDKGAPLRLVVPDPRAYVIHKHWLSSVPDRPMLKRRRDAAQAEVVARLTTEYLTHLPYEPNALGAIPLHLFDEAAPLFTRATEKS
jgi:hypothetical protein